MTPPAAKHVLVVEDDDATREAYALLLSTSGYRVSTASNGQRALEELRRDRPNLILLDLMMPVMDGYAFRAVQRGDDALADIPVIVCTASGDARRCAAHLQVAEYLDKPVDVIVLLDAVRRCC
jgi:CheY-like chemotaxis protein